jgi:hypothetical protein
MIVLDRPVETVDFRVSRENTEPVTVIQPQHRHHWRVDVLCDCHLRTTIAYEGDDYDKMIQRVGEMVMSITVDRVLVYRDGEQYRRCEVR